MENKWIDRCMMCLEVLMNFLVIFCLETVIFGSFPNLEKVLEAENGQFGAPGLFRQLLLMAVPFLFLLIRAKAAHFMSFVALHGAVAAGAVLLLGQGTPDFKAENRGRTAGGGGCGNRCRRFFPDMRLYGDGGRLRPDY
ncbi:MAG: hypothetical protein KH237_15645 [Clostridium sp.]|nr:hypothetical protein [Clostridium sp.]